MIIYGKIVVYCRVVVFGFFMSINMIGGSGRLICGLYVELGLECRYIDDR